MSDIQDLVPGAGQEVNPGTGEPDPGAPVEPVQLPTFLRYAPDRYKNDPKFVEDLSQYKGWGDVLDRMYSGEQELEAMRSQSEIPESPEAYQFKQIVFPEFMAAKEYEQHCNDLEAYLNGTADELKDLSHELGLSNEKAQRIVDLFNQKQFGVFQKAVEHEAEKRAEAEEQLKADWKGKYDANAEIARRAIQTFDDGTFEAEVTAAGMQNSPGLIKMFHRIGKEIGEDTLVPGSTGIGDYNPTLSEKEAEETEELANRYKNSPGLIEDTLGRRRM